RRRTEPESSSASRLSRPRLRRTSPAPIAQRSRRHKNRRRRPARHPPHSRSKMPSATRRGRARKVVSIHLSCVLHLHLLSVKHLPGANAKEWEISGRQSPRRRGHLRWLFAAQPPSRPPFYRADIPLAGSNLVSLLHHRSSAKRRRFALQ